MIHVLSLVSNAVHFLTIFNTTTQIISVCLSIRFFFIPLMEPIQRNHSQTHSLHSSDKSIILLSQLSLPSSLPGWNNQDSLWSLFSLHTLVHTPFNPFHLYRNSAFYIPVLIFLLILPSLWQWVSLWLIQVNRLFQWVSIILLRLSFSRPMSHRLLFISHHICLQ